ncbi:P-loop containing nucleoside triphosphate hydrolase protein [Fomitopsis serialis]|uniref:P-loop containing nucleoside triphosphate hydrolase protein n=1 Tax=Fomitopsis serialis TaxID=139415 RepID=UPI002008A983|nr:P-loop containing nucleoside triphosphate hydrolase protein [Neoantrodia serialis]KAH9936685.1 P-loop containing nucleoside triphosphate hydrolase protein [Neoantrodia serialis]
MPAVKRRAASPPIDERDSPASPKRARTEDDEEHGNQRTKKGKARQEEGEVDIQKDLEEETPEQEAPDEDEERKFEEENEEIIRETIMNKGKTQGGVAEMGIIESLEMHNFMCHKYLTLRSARKSTSLLATATGRGNGLKSFIREGQQVSEVTVVLKNQGEEAYRPKEYGKSIVITRRFTKEGSSSYKIKNKDGRVVSTKREECRQPDEHPDPRRGAAVPERVQPADKYKFFLRGTQLSQLSEEYQTCLEGIQNMQKTVKRKSEGLPDLEESLEEAMSRFEEAQKAREQRHKADDLKKELAWAHVASKEEELAKIDEASEKIAAIEGSLEDMGDIQHLLQQKKGLQDESRDNRQKLQKLKEEEKQMDATVRRCTKLITEYDAQMRRSASVKREETDRKIDEAQHAFDEAERQLNAVKEEKEQKENEARETETQGQELKRQKDEAQQDVMNAQGALQQSQEAEKNKLAPYGNKMDQVLASIERMNWYGNRPVGPLGLYVKVQDPVWAPLMRVQLGGLMGAFAITDARDRAQLGQLLTQTNNRNSIIISEVDLFDYSHGEPPPDILTVLRVLDVSDQYVLRVMINSASIESTYVARTRAQLDNILLGTGRGGFGWSADLYTVRRFPEGGGSSNPLTMVPGRDPRQQLFASKDAAGEKRRLQEALQQANANCEDITGRFQAAHQRFVQLKQEIGRLNTRENQLHNRCRELKLTRDTLLLERNEEQSITVSTIEDAKVAMEAEKQMTIEQFKVVQQQKNAIDAAQNVLQEKMNTLQKQINEFEGDKSTLQKQIEELSIERMDAQKATQYYETKLKEEEDKVKDAQTIEANVQKEFENWTAKALQYCARWLNPRKADEVQRNLDAVQAALREREKRQGASVEDMTIEVNKKKAALDTAKRDVKQMLSLIRVYFQYHLSNRGYYGKVLFDHVAGTLQLKVQTDDQTLTQNSREKDPRSLSGGEKSFSTICLLLSLWESIGCPIRCLDEFDVFMDAVNRRISMKMMIDTANASDSKQYVLITPQDMTNIVIGNTVRVHRMTDPERGQGVLAFS